MVGVICRSAIQCLTWGADEDGVADVLHVLQEAITATRKHSGGEALEVWQDATRFYSKSYLAWSTYVDPLVSALSSSNSSSSS